MAIDRDTAVEIINEYNSGDFEDRIECPVEESELIDKAEYLYSESKQAFENGLRDNAIQAIIFLGDTACIEDPPRFPQPDESTKPVPTGVEDTYPRRSSGGLSEGDEREIENFPVKENLPVPQHIEGDPDPMPRDLSSDTVTDKVIRKLSGEYQAYLSRTTYLLGLATSDLMNAEHLLEAERSRVWRGLDLIDPNGDGKKQKLVKLIEAEILADAKVAKLTGEVNHHQKMVIMLKSLKEIYGGNVERLSREWTMRQNEWEKSRR